ncbi:MAG: GTP-binding protein [Promethearchaeota archaeon]|nr:MAG: GTP-binding protein [Candidatus Lokiarchaeota archaeon]
MSAYDYTFKFLLLGDESAEKSAITKRYCYNIFNPSERLTIGVDFHVKLIEFKNKKIKLQIWDVGGEERFRFLLPTYSLGANAAFLLYDITRPQTLDNIKEWVNIIRQKGGDIPIMLIGTKLDLAEEKSRVPKEYGIRVAKKNKLSSFAEVSAKTGQNINKAFEILTELALERIEGRDYNQFIITDGIPYEEANIEFVETSKNNTHFKINDYLSLRLENDKTNIYVGGRLFRQCKYLLLDITKSESNKLKKIDSIDEAEAELDKKMELDHSIISPETEFWGHRSNLQAWYESDYDTRILHRNLAFPLLKELAEEGDNLARNILKQEIAKRLESGYPSVVLYLIEEDYYKYLRNEELDTIFENLQLLKHLQKWFKFFSEDLKKRVIKKLYQLHCPYCGCKVENNQVQKVLKGKGLRCLYCYSLIIKDD